MITTTTRRPAGLASYTASAAAAGCGDVMATTPQNAQRHVPAAPGATKTPRTPAGPLPRHTRQPAVTGPSVWENSGGSVSSPPGPVPHHYPGASFRPHQDAQVTQTVGVNPDAPAQRSASPDVDTSTPITAGNPLAFTVYGSEY